jgi:hypothetical protein
MPRYRFQAPDGRMETIEAPNWDSSILLFNQRHKTHLPFDPGNIPPGFQQLTRQGRPHLVCEGRPSPTPVPVPNLRGNDLRWALGVPPFENTTGGSSNPPVAPGISSPSSIGEAGAVASDAPAEPSLMERGEVRVTASKRSGKEPMMFKSRD